VLFVLEGCSSGTNLAPTERSVDSLANGCFTLSIATGEGERYLTPIRDGAQFGFRTASPLRASRFLARAADLGTFIFRDAEASYPISDPVGLARSSALDSDVLSNWDEFVSPAEWDVVPAEGVVGRFHLHNRATDQYLGKRGLVDELRDAASVAMTETTECAAFPELSVDATGSVVRTQWDDGSVYGFVDAHSHMFTNFGFGGGGTFHGSPFHRLGVEHALPDCQPFHGAEGRRDLLGYFYGGSGPLDIDEATDAIVHGEISHFDHFTAGYPQFTDWPDGPHSSTHQTQYYKWIERAYLGGLRLIVQHATSNQTLCEFMTGVGAQYARISCDEMVAAERTIDEVRALERYVDAQSGGPGLGWFRVVTTPAAARQVIASGKLAVVLGIETSHLFDCRVTPRDGEVQCDAARVLEQLDHFHERGVRALFPVHKFDNAFSAGDGHRGFIELGNTIATGQYSNFTTDCDPTVDAPFDHGGVAYGGLNMTRADYFATPPFDFQDFGVATLGTLLQVAPFLSTPPLAGEYCQNHGLTALGETLILEMMKRGMIIEIDHLPQRSYARAVEMLVDNDYPAAGTHGSTADGALYTLGGISVMGLPRCGDPADPLAAVNQVRARIAAITNAGGYPAQGFGFDLNGFAGAPGPRFGATGCADAQTDPVTYPFTSYAGDVVFEAPELGERTVDFNLEGMVHIGLVPELIEDARHLGVTDADLEPLFRSAEGYLRMWERAESRAAAIRASMP